MKKDDAIHLHNTYGRMLRPFELEDYNRTSIGIGLCGAQKLPRGRFVRDPETVTCNRCLQLAKNGPRPQPDPAPEPPLPPTKRAVKGTPSGVIVAKIKQNPRKRNTMKYDRMALLLKFDGKTVKEFAAAEGNLETLRNAIKENIVEIKTKV